MERAWNGASRLKSKMSEYPQIRQQFIELHVNENIILIRAEFIK